VIVHTRNNFTAASKNLARYRSENNFVLGHQNNYVERFKRDNAAANSFDISATELTILYNFINGST
jgi:hypothetical protein